MGRDGRPETGVQSYISGKKESRRYSLYFYRNAVCLFLRPLTSNQALRFQSRETWSGTRPTNVFKAEQGLIKSPLKAPQRFQRHGMQS